MLLSPIASTSHHPFQPALKTKLTPIIINGILSIPTAASGGRVKKFKCTHSGCDKSYTRPTRLEEHIRTHTGERPFICPTCPSTFLRQSHLVAHARIHSDSSEKKLECPEIGCDKRFWTNQHVRKHLELVHGEGEGEGKAKGKRFECPTCQAIFRKHHLLRTHLVSHHAGEGIEVPLPFHCDFVVGVGEEGEECGKSFQHLSALKAHVRTHDPSRYLCSHPLCLPLPLSSRQHPNWTSLQRHTKLAHPPTCSYPECNGKTFTSARGLRGHLEGVHGSSSEEGVEGRGGKRGRGRGERGRGRRRKRERMEEEGTEEEGTTTQLETSGSGTDTSGTERESRKDKRKRMRRETGVGVGLSKIQEEGVVPGVATGAGGGGVGESGPFGVGERMGKGNGMGEMRFEAEKGWPCIVEGCERGFGSARALEQHCTKQHLPLPSIPSSTSSLSNLPFSLPLSSQLTSTTELSFTTLPTPRPRPLLPSLVREKKMSLLDFVTGRAYSSTSTARTGEVEEGQGGEEAEVREGEGVGRGKERERTIACPFASAFPSLKMHELSSTDFDFITNLSQRNEEAEEAEGAEEQEGGKCEYRFSRIYDCERHLRAVHGIEIGGLSDWGEEEEEEESEVE